MHQGDNNHYVNTGLDYDLGIKSGFMQMQAEHEGETGSDVSHGRPVEQLLIIVRRADELLCPAVEIQYQEKQRQRASVIIKQAQVLPAKILLARVQCRYFSLGFYGFFPSPVDAVCNKMIRYLR